MTTGILAPYTVLDLTDERGEIGPMLLGDLGADVIRIEPPGGTNARRCPPFIDDAPEDLCSLQFIAFNRNKRSIVIDRNKPEDMVALRALIERTDFLFESGRLLADTWGISVDDLSHYNKQLIHVRLTPFGDDGPHADLASSDLTIVSMAGPVGLQGSPERPPNRLSVPQVWRHAGVEAAAGSLVALTRRQQSGEGQFVDLSAQCTMTWTMLNAMSAKAIQGFEFGRASSSLGVGDGRIELVHPTADGHLVAIPNGPVLMGCTEGFIADGVVDETYREVDWAAYEAEGATLNPEQMQQRIQDATARCRQFFAGHGKDELLEYGLANNCTLAPVNTLGELLALEHMAIREYWEPLTLPNGKTVKTPGLWAKPSSFSLAVKRSAPKLDEHGDEIRQEFARKESVPSTSGEQAVSSTDSKVLPFEGIRVADFSWVGVGPISAKYLADHGASVVRVETEGRPDVLRGGLPFKDNEPGWNRSQFFGDFNTSKRSLTLNMKNEAGIDLARRLITNSDVFIESFAPGAITRMGLEYNEVRKLNPGLIMVSTCLMGQTGPASELAGYGYHAAAIAGFYEVTGWPDQPPSGPWIAYTDTIAPRFISVLLAAAIDRKRRTGEGCYIDVAQIETALHFLGPELLDLQVNGYSATRTGNRSRFIAPEGIYPCAGDDEWCAISVDTDTAWKALCKVISQAQWQDDESLATLAGRQSRHDEIDAAIGAWTQTLSPKEAVAQLQANGVPSGAVQRSGDLLEDPQYQHRQFYRYYDHTEMGNIPYAGHQYNIAGYDNGPRGPAPCIGEHSFEVLTEVIGLTDEEVAEAYANEAIG